MNKLWFKRKCYGWGWTPATWEGWIVLLTFIALEITNFYRLDINSHSTSDTLINFIPQTFLITFILILICYKTGEKPRWQRGDKE